MTTNKKLVYRVIISVLFCLLLGNVNVCAQPQANVSHTLTNTSLLSIYCKDNYNNEILSILTDKYIISLQTNIDTIKKYNNNITDDELNVFIMDTIQAEYNNTSKYRSSNVPYSQGILNSEEKSLFSSNPVKGLFAVSSANTATTWTNNLFESSVTYLGNGDAYRHSFWQALLAEAYGVSYAKQWGDAHESESPSGVDKTMDLRNNSIGREVGANISGSQYIESRLSSTLLTKISNGSLWRVIDKQLCSTDGTGRK